VASASLPNSWSRSPNFSSTAERTSGFVALPTLIVYFLLKRYFIAGLTIGAEKG
jgi:ABC-type glycerol-3-phosphate transport system permease component